MQIKTMNKRINQTKDDMNYVFGELKLKLNHHLRKVGDSTYAFVNCYNVKIHSDCLISNDDIKAIEEKFLIELNYYDVAYSPEHEITEVWYYFDYVKFQD